MKYRPWLPVLSISISLTSTFAASSEPITLLTFENEQYPSSDGWIQYTGKQTDAVHSIQSGDNASDGRFLRSTGDDEFGWGYQLPSSTLSADSWTFEVDVRIRQFDPEARAGISIVKFGLNADGSPDSYQMNAASVNAEWNQWRIASVDGEVSVQISGADVPFSMPSGSLALGGEQVENGIWFGFANNNHSATVDFDNVSFQVITPLTGDYNCDGAISTADYDLWVQTFGLTGNSLAADGNGDGVVDPVDYVIWRDAFDSGTNAIATPEPNGAIALASLLCSCWALTPRKS